MNYNTLILEYLDPKKGMTDAHEISEQIIKRFMQMPISVDDINRQINAFAAQKDDAIMANYSGSDIGLLRGSIIKPLNKITDGKTVMARQTLMFEARSYLANLIGRRTATLSSGNGLERDVNDLLSYEDDPDKLADRIQTVLNGDAETKKNLFMTIVKDIQYKMDKVDVRADLTDKEIIDNIPNLNATFQAATLRSARDSFVNKYGVTFTQDELDLIQSVYDKGQDANMSFINRIGIIASPYYPELESTEIDRLSIMTNSDSDYFEFAEENEVVRQALSAAHSYNEARRTSTVTTQLEAFKNMHNVTKSDIMLQVTNTDGSTSVFDYVHSDGFQYAKSIIMMTKDKAYSADVNMHFDQSLVSYLDDAAVDFPAGGLEGKDFAKECRDLFTAMDSVDHWYQRSSDEFKDTKKLLNAIATGKPMSRDTANENSAKLAEYADKYIKDHCGRQLNEREQARMDIMTKISRTFHAKQTAVAAARKNSAEAHSQNRFSSEANRANIGEQAIAEHNYERAPYSIRGVAEPDVAMPDTREEIEALNAKFDEIHNANVHYGSRIIKTNLTSNYPTYFIHLGSEATKDLMDYAKDDFEFEPENFDPARAVALTVISTMLKMDRESSNPDYLKNAKPGETIKITAGPFEELLTKVPSPDDIVNALMKTATIQRFCNDITPGRISDMLINHKDIKLAQAIKSEFSNSALSKSIAIETNRRRENEAKINVPQKQGPRLS